MKTCNIYPSALDGETRFLKACSMGNDIDYVSQALIV